MNQEPKRAEKVWMWLDGKKQLRENILSSEVDHKEIIRFLNENGFVELNDSIIKSLNLNIKKGWDSGFFNHERNEFIILGNFHRTFHSNIEEKLRVTISKSKAKEYNKVINNENFTLYTICCYEEKTDGESTVYILSKLLTPFANKSGHTSSMRVSWKVIRDISLSENDCLWFHDYSTKYVVEEFVGFKSLSLDTFNMTTVLDKLKELKAAKRRYNKDKLSATSLDEKHKLTTLVQDPEKAKTKEESCKIVFDRLEIEHRPKNKIGFLGELICDVFLSKEHKNPDNEVQWSSVQISTTSPYDFQVTTKQGERKYFEVKSTSTSNKTALISQNEVKFMQSELDSWQLIKVDLIKFFKSQEKMSDVIKMKDLDLQRKEIETIIYETGWNKEGIEIFSSKEIDEKVNGSEPTSYRIKF